MRLPKESWSDCVRLNYQHLEDNSVEPVTIRIPGYVPPRARFLNIHGKIVQVLMVSQLRRSFDARIAAHRPNRDH